MQRGRTLVSSLPVIVVVTVSKKNIGKGKTGNEGEGKKERTYDVNVT